MEAVTPPAVPDVPDEGALAEQFAMLVEETVVQPLIKIWTACSGKQFAEHSVVP